ncbi:MAG TPA: hypothetical protein PK304_07335 [Mobilitalea sp.]|nr:hypothetical protein [Mobilitalea sp.]
MRTKNSDIAVKIFLVVVGVILTGLIIAWSTGVFKDKKNDLSRSTEKINNAISSLAEFDLLVYEGESIRGDTIIDLIKDLKDKDLDITVTVVTNENIYNKKNGVTYSNSNQYVDKDYSQKKTDENYINPNGNFIGKVKKNENGMVENITFTQQK